MQLTSPTLKSFLRQNVQFFLFWAGVALAVRVIFLWKFRLLTNDSFVYGEIAKNWMQHGVFGQTYEQGPEPTFIRLPGYPLFLVIVWFVTGVEHYTAALVVQVVVDVLTCFVVADLARRIVVSVNPPLRQQTAKGWSTLLNRFFQQEDAAPKIAFVLTALCPFFANYAAVALTETWAIFFAALAMDATVAAFDRAEMWKYWAFGGAALGAGILLRPDGGMLLGVIGVAGVWLAWRRRSKQLALGLVLTVAIAIAPLVPWTIRNWRAFHLFQPLTTTTATMPSEFVPHGFQRWSRTWIADYSSLEDVWFKVDGEAVTTADLPPRAFDDEKQRQRTDELFQAYINNGATLSSTIDDGFGELARERIQAHKFRYYVGLPLMRAADLWLRPRTEMLPIDPHWWRLWPDDQKQFREAVALGAINLLYLAGAAIAVIRRKIRWAGFLLLFFVLRTAFLAWMPNPEPRYVLECYPAVLAMAAATVVRVGIPRGSRPSE